MRLLNLRLSFFISTAISFETAGAVAFPILSLDGRGQGEGEKEFSISPHPSLPPQGGKVKEGKCKSTLPGD
jgi:hypothetical protein